MTDKKAYLKLSNNSPELEVKFLSEVGAYDSDPSKSGFSIVFADCYPTAHYIYDNREEAEAQHEIFSKQLEEVK